jgi:hypothetical protein
MKPPVLILALGGALLGVLFWTLWPSGGEVVPRGGARDGGDVGLPAQLQGELAGVDAAGREGAGHGRLQSLALARAWISVWPRR